MPMSSVKLIPGLDVEKTPTLNEAGISFTQLGRFRESLFQKIGGWARFYALTVAGIPRALHGWEDLNSATHLAVGSTTSLSVISSGTLTTITPQTVTSNIAPNFSTVSTTPTVTIIDANIANVTILDSVFFDTPISVGGIILSGTYPIASIVGTTSYTITAATNATSTVNNVGAVPTFTTTAGSNAVTVNLTAHGRAAGDSIDFPISTTGDGVTISGVYTITSITSANAFVINAAQQGIAGATTSMNGGLAQIVYYINLGPTAAGSGFGLGGFGTGGFGTGTVPASQTGTPITATDWTLDNWGQILLACPQNGGLYYWDPTGGYQNAALISGSNAPQFNTGMFVSTRQQIAVAFGSTAPTSIGVAQNPMLVKWCDVGNFFEWRVTSTTQAGSRILPIGSMIVGGIATQQQNFLWTDLGLWSMSYIGPPDVFGFNQVASKCGLIGMHAVTEYRGTIFWMGASNFFRLDGNGVSVIPCPVWDAVFQNLDTVHQAKARIAPNTGPNEIGWFFPSLSGGTGENDTLVKFNLAEPGMPWDVSSLPRSAWIDQSVLGPPIGATSTGIIYQHETTNDADGQPISWAMETGYFMIAEGHEMAFVDWLLPDFRWSLYGQAASATVTITLYAVDYPGDTPRTYGPFSVTQATEFVSPRLRGRQMKMRFEGNDLGTFVRMGSVRFRFAPDGRR